MGLIFPRGEFSRRMPYREKRENYPHAKISTFTVIEMASPKIEAKNHNFGQRAVIKFCVNLGKSPTETKQMIDMAGDGANVSRSMVFRWHKIFRDGQASIDDDERPGWPTEIGDALIEDIRHAVQEDGRITVREISDSFDLSTSNIHTILT